MLDIRSFPGFDRACSAVLEFLHDRLGFDLWMVTRTHGEDWIVLQAADHGYGVREGTVFRWADSFCCRMVRDRGPRIAPRSGSVPAYASAPIGRQVTIGAYVGVPLTLEDGSLFGTLCAIDPAPQPEALAAELPLVELLARLLCSVLAADLRACEHARRAERAEVEALADGLTGLYNRRGWDRLVIAEEGRCRRFGYPACVVSIDLDDLKRVNDAGGHAAGDELIRAAGHAIVSAVREPDVVARLGGDEFAVLGVECGSEGARGLVGRIRTALDAAGIHASLGMARRVPGMGLGRALTDADEAMYRAKRERRVARGA